MKRVSQWSVDGVADAKDGSPPTVVMAWARDIETGEPIYILELDAKRTGSKCSCECPSCNLPLTAVNAAKKEYLKRPHFRHPDGAEKSDCMYLAARLAALQLLRDQGFILLPKRQQSAHSIGLSGTQYEAWVDHRPERVAIRDFNFSDKASAILTLADGRRLRFTLFGDGASITDTGDLIASIRLNLSDPSLASMSIEELRSRITLEPDDVCWLSHWADAELLSRAKVEADKKANEFMDLQGAYADDLRGVDKSSRHETVLHLEVKRILAESLSLRVPALEAYAFGESDGGVRFEREWVKPSETIELLDVALEKRTAGVIPDVIAVTHESHGGLLMLEITVTNHLNEARLGKIRALNIPALEIDLSQSGGLLTRDELRNLVIDGLEVKKWIHHPEMVEQARQMEVEISAKVSEADRAATEVSEYRRAVLATPFSEIAKRYLDAISEYAQYDGVEVTTQESRAGAAAAKARLDSESAKLAIHGCSEASDVELTLGRQGVIPRILSIKQGKGVGYLLGSAMEVMNAIKQSSPRNSSNHSIYLIAEKVYRQPEFATPSWYHKWVAEIKWSLSDGEQTYVRSRRYDKLLSILFPELAAGLGKSLQPKKPTPKRDEPEILTVGEIQKRNDAYWAARRLKALQEGGVRSKPIFRQLGIDVEVVLAEAQTIIDGDVSIQEWFSRWNTRYQLHTNLRHIVELLVGEGFAQAQAEFKVWFDALPQKNEKRPYGAGSQEKQAVNRYAEMKGRSGPRK